MTIYNMPDYAKEYTYIVVIEDSGGYWFYGAYNDLSKAQEAAISCEGIIINSMLI